MITQMENKRKSLKDLENEVSGEYTGYEGLISAMRIWRATYALGGAAIGVANTANASTSLDALCGLLIGGAIIAAPRIAQRIFYERGLLDDCKEPDYKK